MSGVPFRRRALLLASVVGGLVIFVLVIAAVSVAFDHMPTAVVVTAAVGALLVMGIRAYRRGIALMDEERDA